MFPLAALITNLTSSETDEQRRKEIDRARAEQVVRMREEERKKNDLVAARARAIEMLKRADQFIKHNKLDQAQSELDRAKVIDPENMYIQAFEERIAHLRKQRQNHGNEQGVDKMSTQATISHATSPDAKRIAARLLFHEIDQSIAAKNLEQAKAQFRKAIELDPYNMAITGYQQRLDNLSKELGRQHLQEEKRTSKLEDEARHRAAEETRLEQQEEVRHEIARLREHVGALIADKAWDVALAEVARGMALNPQNKELRALDERLHYLQEEDRRCSKIEEAKRRADEISHHQVVSEVQETLEALQHAKTARIVELLKHFEQLIKGKAWDEAIQQLARVKQIDPENPSIHTAEKLLTLLREEEAQHRTEHGARQQVTPEEQLKDEQPEEPTPSNNEAQNVFSKPFPVRKRNGESDSYHFHGSLVNGVWQRTYAQCLKQVWQDGFMSDEERQLLSILRSAFDISNDGHEQMEQEAQWEVYFEAIVNAWSSGVITPAESERLDTLREKLHISGDVHLKIERNVRHELLKRGTNTHEVLGELRRTFAGFFQRYVLGAETQSSRVAE